jgi:hypothetical protein
MEWIALSERDPTSGELAVGVWWGRHDDRRPYTAHQIFRDGTWTHFAVVPEPDDLPPKSRPKLREGYRWSGKDIALGYGHEEQGRWRVSQSGSIVWRVDDGGGVPAWMTAAFVADGQIQPSALELPE